MEPPRDPPSSSEDKDMLASYWYLPIWLPLVCICSVALAFLQWRRMTTKFRKASKEKDEELTNIRRELEHQLQQHVSQDSFKETPLASSPLLMKPRLRPPPVSTGNEQDEVKSTYAPPSPMPVRDYRDLPKDALCTSPVSDWDIRRRSIPSSPCEGSMRRRDSSFPRTWQRGQLLGSGSFGNVYMGVRANGTFFAVKVMTLHSGLPKERLIEVKREVELMSKLKHRNIVRYLGVSIEANELNIFMEYVQGGSLGALSRRHGQRLEELSVAAYVKQILMGVDYLHENKIIHRDLKGDNILIANDGCIKLADFGTSKKIQNETQHSAIHGTPLWMAPEAITKTDEVTLKADIWSVGCVICELLNCGKPPWPMAWESSWQAIYTIGNWKKPLPPEIPEGLSSVTMDLLYKCFEPMPTRRSCAKELLSHAWLEESCGDSTTESDDGEDTEKHVALRLNEMIAASVDKHANDIGPHASRPTNEPAWLRTASTLFSTHESDLVGLTTPTKKAPAFLSLPPNSLNVEKVTSRSTSFSSNHSSPVCIQNGTKEHTIRPAFAETSPLAMRVSQLITPSENSLCGNTNSTYLPSGVGL
eukprot:TRINITY_DN4934_c1_g1_i2.p1 TRINITY_DN4934_c1_g1~~TRINITY_DN4934_c1_g1_i2.p1  ORF type:complete len:588 (+),score=94.79 TRINITY_DN4934_c1_g1_i2:48-1811(+)